MSEDSLVYLGNNESVTYEKNARNLLVQWRPFRLEYRRILRIHPEMVSERLFL